MKYDGKTVLDAVVTFVTPLTSNRISAVTWRAATGIKLKKGKKYAKAALDILYLLQRR